MPKKDASPAAQEASPAGAADDTAEPITDALTGVYSIEYFAHQLRSEVAYALRHGIPLSLLLVGVDFLGDLTESFGREARDRLLVRVAEVVREHVRTEDILARYGVGELALLARGTPLAESSFLATRIRQSVESAGLTHRGMELPITVSVGVATMGTDVTEHAAVVQSAERALEQARRAGNTVAVADPT